MGADTAVFTQTFNNRNAGANKTLTPAGAVNDGNGGANYAVTLANNLTGVINPRAITVTAINASKVYDGTTIATGTPTLSLALIAGDTATVLAQAFQTAAVGSGNKVIVPIIAINDANGGANYAVTPVNVPAGTVTPKALTMSGLAASNSPYDGTVVASLTGIAALQTAVAAGTGTALDGKPFIGDAVSLSGTATGAFGGQNAGNSKPVSVTGITLGGAQAGNYTLTPHAGIAADITPAGLTITASNQSKTYGQAVSFGGGSTQFSSAGLQGGETIGTVTMACLGGSEAAAVSGSPYPITPSAAIGGTFTAGNYSISYSTGILSVTQADQTISFGALAPATYGDAPTILTATAGSGLAVSYSSSDPTVADVSGNTLTILKAGATTITASQSGDGNFTPAVPVAQSLTVNHPPFKAWALDPAQGLTAGVNDGTLDDPDLDGISNLLEFVLGGAPMVSSQAILPKLTKPAATWVFEYDRSDLALPPATTQVVEYGNDLTGWAPLTIPAISGGAVTITPGTPSDHVSVAIPNLGHQTFVRLKVSQ